ncbi:uncharacterized protein BT62DRAFT_990538 [Guyanagaster necrorhizus]|uniref:BRCA2 OB1 domain-containing protein n=1 Tax=Guyanagaster necrorhizus TaxID=856835 RepID=A0A9P7W431_9AGAR|nr:uncharacterized protein BT62DRAFT_990538 [Guyanagaster necrorhizus MCA 3950]KAG7452267.1 hypothetical protein BT62DRAFT_990538 [Guyanagaster necrorhizus MCA 3950]
MRRSLSPKPSPNRKRQRLSSPNFDEELNLSQDELEALDRLETCYSQKARNSDENETNKSGSMHEGASQNPFDSNKPEPSISAIFPASGFTSAAAIASTSTTDMDLSPTCQPSSSNSPIQEQDFSSWFAPGPPIKTTAFQTGGLVAATSLFSSAKVPGFSTASKGIIAPSSAALEKARQKMKEWQREDTDGLSIEESIQPSAMELFRTASSLTPFTPLARPALINVQNTPDTPGTPSPAPFSRPLSKGPTNAAVASLRTKQQAFKSPLMKPSTLKESISPIANSKNNPQSSTQTSRAQHPLASSPLSTSLSTPKLTLLSTRFSTPNSKVRITPAKFVTPFKPGMRPGEPGREKLLQQTKEADKKLVLSPSPNLRLDTVQTESQASLAQKPKTHQFFDLTKPPNRKTLASSGFVPQRFTPEELVFPGMSLSELEQIHPRITAYYSFYRKVPSTQYDDPPPFETVHADAVMDPMATFKYLKEAGCSLVSKPWIDNHWGLILWKLAGMTCLEPEKEWDEKERRWCWEEVYRQMLYRYEREINQGIRPSLRLIATQDAPSTSPMVLCVSEIKWTENILLENGEMYHGCPELELTDGWYKIRAQVDAPLTRAIRKGTLAIGRKIAVVGAKLDSERKDPQEILEAYNSIKLILAGNSTHLAPWHAKLGFQRELPVATMHSLTRDGGIVAAMDLLIVKVYPIAYFEFIHTNKGRINNGPLNEKEELTLRDEWQRRREFEESKLREEFDKNTRRYRGYADRLECKAGNHFRPGEDGPPDCIDDLYDKLEEPEEAGKVISAISLTDAGWLVQRIQKQLEKDQENLMDDIEKELAVSHFVIREQFAKTTTPGHLSSKGCP